QLMLALYRSGRQADALRAYARLREQLAEELGIDPSTELRDLEQQILVQDDAVAAMPSGLVTFLFTDIEGSTTIWDQRPPEMTDALQQYSALVETTVRSSGGLLLKSKGEGDSTLSVFARPTDGVRAALAVQLALDAASFAGALRLPTRISVHTGEAQLRDN